MTKPTLEQRIAVGDEAERLLNGQLFNSVVSTLVAENIADLMAVEPGSPKSVVAHAKMRALNDIKEGLRRLVNDAAMARKELKGSNQMGVPKEEPQ